MPNISGLKTTNIFLAQNIGYLDAGDMLLEKIQSRFLRNVGEMDVLHE